MGNWGVDILDGDQEMDLYETYVEFRKEQDVEQAAAAALAEADAWSFSPSQLNTVAMAAARLWRQELTPELAAAAIAAIDDEEDDGIYWLERARDERTLEERRRAVRRFRSVLKRFLDGAKIPRSEMPVPLGEPR